MLILRKEGLFLPRLFKEGILNKWPLRLSLEITTGHFKQSKPNDQFLTWCTVSWINVQVDFFWNRQVVYLETVCWDYIVGAPEEQNNEEPTRVPLLSDLPRVMLVEILPSAHAQRASSLLVPPHSGKNLLLHACFGSFYEVFYCFCETE